MRKMFWVVTFGVCCACMLPSIGVAQEKTSDTAASAAPTSGPRAEFLTELKVEQDKFMKLAEAIPADKYTWRPSADVRSVAEVYLHVAAATSTYPS
jgi:hypothetical protein